MLPTSNSTVDRICLYFTSMILGKTGHLVLTRIKPQSRGQMLSDLGRNIYLLQRRTISNQVSSPNGVALPSRLPCADNPQVDLAQCPLCACAPASACCTGRA